VRGYEPLDIIEIFPHRVVQLIVQAAPGGEPELYRGSCFRLWSPVHFLTAAHCVRDLPAERVLIVAPTAPGKPLRCDQVVVHKASDAAIVRTIDPIPEKMQQLRLGKYDALGAIVHLSGPVIDHPERVETFRALTSTIQRRFIHKDYEGLEYEALEISQPIPAGMSGTACYKEYPPGHVVGIATGTIESKIAQSSIEEIEHDGKVTITKEMRLIQYGVVAAIDPLVGWLREVMGPPPENVIL
jgi:hypothetical protein